MKKFFFIVGTMNVEQAVETIAIDKHLSQTLTYNHILLFLTYCIHFTCNSSAGGWSSADLV
jgi:hypothetical protein